MLSAKPWKLEAIVRLFQSLVVCVYAGSLLVGLLRLASDEKGGAQFAVAKARFEAANQRALRLRSISSVQQAANDRYVKNLALGDATWRLVLPLAVVALACLGVMCFLVRKPWQPEALPHRLAALFLAFYGGLCVEAWAMQLVGAGGGETSVGHMLIGTLSFQGAALVLVARFLREHHTTWTEAFGFSNHWLHVLLIGIILACFYLPISQGLLQLSIVLMRHLRIQPEEQQAVQSLGMAHSWVDRVGLGAVTILLAPAAEETLFRGILYPWIKKAGFPRLALWATSLLFAAIHFDVARFLPLFVLALSLAVLYERTNNLLGSITAHALFNAFNFVLFYLRERQMS